MMKASWCIAMCAAAAGALHAQSGGTCACGANPPGPPRAREVRPYASTPADLRPYGKFTEPYYEHYQKTVEYNGAAREARVVKASEVDEVRIGFLGPVENHPDQDLGRMMLNGAQLAIEEANARGGYGGKPFKLMVHNDQALWGASSNEIVKLTYDDKVWALLGSISGDSTHIALRASLKTELPIVNSAATDPTIPETIIPWYLSTIQDDRVQCYTLARRIYSDLKLARVAILRINDRYGRFGVGKFKDASRRLGHPVVIEQKYFGGDTDFSRQLRIISDSRVDAVVIWGDQAPAAGIVKQMRELGMKQRVFGSFRTIGDRFLAEAGTAAEGVEAVFPYDPVRDDPAWLGFRARFAKRFEAQPEVFASLSYDTMNILLDAICRAGLNRGIIRDALAGLEHYRGVTGEMDFDTNSKNTVPMYLASVEGGKFRYRRYPMEQPYARVAEGGTVYLGPATPDGPAGPQPIVLFGPRAAELAASSDIARVTREFGGKYEVAPVDSDAPWGKASTELVRLLVDRKALAVIATGRNASHLAEQLAVKTLVPTLAIADDQSLTNVNIPWIFRLPSTTSTPAALRILFEAAGRSGPNRGKLRDVLADGASFDARGEPTIAPVIQF
jgi:ABC-type branched-subunit amino acid transport system substrate-binding protein